MLVFAQVTGEFERFSDTIDKVGSGTFAGYLESLSLKAVILFIAGCVIGTGIGYTGWWCRRKVSATSYTIIGVMNKCLTVLCNFFIWDQHAKPTGIASLFICLLGGAIYRQAPMRKEFLSEEAKIEAKIEEGKPLMLVEKECK